MLAIKSNRPGRQLRIGNVKVKGVHKIKYEHLKAHWNNERYLSEAKPSINKQETKKWIAYCFILSKKYWTIFSQVK